MFVVGCDMIDQFQYLIRNICSVSGLKIKHYIFQGIDYLSIEIPENYLILEIRYDEIPYEILKFEES
jgi:hypothetical protein